MLTIDAPLQPPPSPSPLRPINTSMPSTPPATSTTSSGSLYHICRSVLDKLSTVDGMANYLEVETTTDPVSKLSRICRLGYPLCTLYNALNPAKPLSVENNPTLNARNCCKAVVYYFIVACRNDLLFPEEDMFTITNLFTDDTNGFVKVNIPSNLLDNQLVNLLYRW
jgi:cell division control protein 24